MGESDQELILLFHVKRILEREKTSAAACIEGLYEFLFERESFQRPQNASAIRWDIESLERALRLAKEIAVTYAAHYQDPRVIPVTYYKREKRVRMELDRRLSPILKAALAQSHATWPVRDLLLNEPIFYLKEQARKKGFPRNKSGVASIRGLSERFWDGLGLQRSA